MWLVPKLKFEHVKLTSYSKMRVDLAAQVCFNAHICMQCIHTLQVLSESVANALEQTGGEEVSETVKFVRNMDKFFDCLNVTNFTNGYHKRKVFQNPKNDFRLKVMEATLLLHYNVMIFIAVAGN